MPIEDWSDYLRRNQEDFVKYLDIEHGLLDACLSEDILTYAQFNNIRAKSPREEQVRLFLQILQSLDSKYRPAFVAILLKYQRDRGEKMAMALGFTDLLNQEDQAAASLPALAPNTITSQMTASLPALTPPNAMSSEVTASLPASVTLNAMTSEVTASLTASIPPNAMTSKISASLPASTPNTMTTDAAAAGLSALPSTKTTPKTVGKDPVLSGPGLPSDSTDYAEGHPIDETGSSSGFSRENSAQFSELGSDYFSQESGSTLDSPESQENPDDQRRIIEQLKNRVTQLEKEKEKANIRVTKLEKEKEKANIRVTKLEKDKNDDQKAVRELSDRLLNTEVDVSQIKKSLPKLGEIDERMNVIEMQVALVKNTHNDSQSLIIGDHMIARISETNLQKTQTRSLPEGKVADFIKHLTESCESSYNRIILCIGTNHCTSRDFKIDDVIQQYAEIIDIAKTKVDHPMLVTISSVPPRLDSDHCQRNVDKLNAELSSVAQRKIVTFVDNDGIFKCLNGKPNRDYLEKDGVSLTCLATDRLMENLKLDIDSRVDDAVVEKWLTCTAQ